MLCITHLVIINIHIAYVVRTLLMQFGLTAKNVVFHKTILVALFPGRCFVLYFRITLNVVFCSFI
jgi:hypothetical protein